MVVLDSCHIPSAHLVPVVVQLGSHVGVLLSNQLHVLQTLSLANPHLLIQFRNKYVGREVVRVFLLLVHEQVVDSAIILGPRPLEFLLALFSYLPTTVGS